MRELFSGPGFAGLDLTTTLSDSDLAALLKKLGATTNCKPTSSIPMHGNLRSSTTRRQRPLALRAVAGDKYTYRDLDDFTDTIQRSLKTLPIVSKVERSGVLNENVFPEFFAGAPCAVQAQAGGSVQAADGSKSAGQRPNAERTRAHPQHQHYGRIQKPRRSAQCDHRRHRQTGHRCICEIWWISTEVTIARRRF